MTFDGRDGAISLPQVEADSYSAVCSLIDGCLVCGDVAVPVTVVWPGEPDAVCEDAQGQRGPVGVELVAPVESGDRLLVHGGIAISRLEEEL
jgi:hydrogenase expression/formation protein HypC